MRGVHFVKFELMQGDYLYSVKIESTIDLTSTNPFRLPMSSCKGLLGNGKPPRNRGSKHLELHEEPSLTIEVDTVLGWQQLCSRWKCWSLTNGVFLARGVPPNPHG